MKENCKSRKWQDQNGNDRYTTEVVVDISGRMQMLDSRTADLQDDNNHYSQQGQHTQQQMQQHPSNGSFDMMQPQAMNNNFSQQTAAPGRTHQTNSNQSANYSNNPQHNQNGGVTNHHSQNMQPQNDLTDRNAVFDTFDDDIPF